MMRRTPTITEIKVRIAEPRSVKVAERLRRRIRQDEVARRTRYLDGINYNMPRVGDVFVLVTVAGSRRAIRVMPSGRVRWARNGEAA